MPLRYRYASLSVFALAVGGWLTSCQTAFALRYVKFEISVDNEVVLKASRGIPGKHRSSCGGI